MLPSRGNSQSRKEGAGVASPVSLDHNGQHFLEVPCAIDRPKPVSMNVWASNLGLGEGSPPLTTLMLQTRTKSEFS